MHNNNARKNLDMLEIMEDLREFTEAEGSRDDFEYLLINHVLLDSVNRLSLQHTPTKLEVIWLMRAYVREHIPRLTECRAWQRETRNRRIIMKLNYDGLEDVSKIGCVFDEMRRRGYSDEQVEKVAGKNLLEVFKRIKQKSYTD